MPDRNSNLEPEIRELPSHAEHYATMLGAIYGREGWQALNSRFSLFSFAIYDASIHADFDQQVKQLLFSGDSETLEDDFMGFLSFVNPWDYELPDHEERRTERRRDREQGDNLAAYNRKCAIPLIHSIVQTDSAIAAGALAAVLSIPQDRLPCIVVSSNLRSSRLAWFSTDRTWLGDQLHHLRDVSQIVREFGTFGRERIIYEHIRQTNGYGEQGIGRLLDESSFGSQLITFMDATVAGHSPFATDKDRVLVQVKKQLLILQEDMKSAKERKRERRKKLKEEEKKLKERKEENNPLESLKSIMMQEQKLQEPFKNKVMMEIDNLKTEEEEKLKEEEEKLKEEFESIEYDLDDFESYCHNIASILALLHAAPHIKSAVNEVTLEEETIQMLKTAYAVLDMLQEYKSIGLDYTPAVMCFAKVFEREINLSVVHWVREQLHINLPAFFDRFQSGLEKEDTELDNVNFNSKGTHKGSWRAPMLGESKKALDNSTGTTLLCSIPVNWCVLSKEWNKIIENRNVGAHGPVVKECVANEIKDALETLICSGVFDELHKIKTQLRGAGEIDVPDAGLREFIEDKFTKVTGEKLCITGGKIKKRDMARLCTRDEFYASGKNFNTKIKDLTGLEKANGLKVLFLADNEIENLEALENLTSLKTLNLKNNSIKDIQPLKDLKALENLDLENNKIEDLKALENLNNLKSLNLKDNCINKSKQKTTLDTLQSRRCKVLL